MTYTGYSANPVVDQMRHYDAQCAQAAAQAAAEEQAAEQFISLLQTPNAPALFASYRGKTPPMSEVFFDALEYKDFKGRLLAMLVRAARTDGDVQELLDDIARDYASRNIEVD